MSTLSIVEQETAAFELIQRHAKMLSASTLVPKEFQANMANCAIGLNIAKRLGADPFMVLQNIDVIHGRPSFRATFLIAMVNASGRFTPLQFRMAGEDQNRTCVAWCKDKAAGETIEGPEVSMAMAKAEGWSTKAGSKWLTMPELMLRYRAAAFFARLYAPDITLGMQTSEESYDVDPEPRTATGRVVTETAPRIDPYQEPLADIPETNVATGVRDLPPVEAEPVEVVEPTERETLLSSIRAWCNANDAKPAELSKKARAFGLIPPGKQLADLDADAMREIANNTQAIWDGTYTAAGGEA